MKVSPKMTYSGRVVLRMQLCGETIYEKEFHNEGSDRLFAFLAACLAGRWTEAEVKKPYKIKLCKKSSDSTADEVSSCSDFIAMTSAPIIDANNKAVFHFLIPYSRISDSFNVIRMYSAGASQVDDYLAQVNLQEAVEKGDANMVYVLDWYMSVDN